MVGGKHEKMSSLPFPSKGGARHNVPIPYNWEGEGEKEGEKNATRGQGRETRSLTHEKQHRYFLREKKEVRRGRWV